MAEMPTYQKRAVQQITGLDSFRGGHILEIGAEPPFDVARALLAQGAGALTATNVKEGIDWQNKGDGLTYQQADAQNLAASLGTASYDIVFATAFLEHVHDLKAMFDNVFKVLKPGGYAYLSGAPIWSSGKGHHLWVQTSKGLFRFYDPSPIVKPYEHLLLTPEDLRARVQDRGEFTPEDLDKIIDKVYTHPSINRISSTDILAAIRHSDFKPVRVIKRRANRRHKNYKAARKKTDASINIRIHGIDAFLQKPLNGQPFKQQSMFARHWAWARASKWA